MENGSSKYEREKSATTRQKQANAEASSHAKQLAGSFLLALIYLFLKWPQFYCKLPLYY